MGNNDRNKVTINIFEAPYYSITKPKIGSFFGSIFRLKFLVSIVEGGFQIVSEGLKKNEIANKFEGTS